MSNEIYSDPLRQEVSNFHKKIRYSKVGVTEILSLLTLHGDILFWHLELSQKCTKVCNNVANNSKSLVYFSSIHERNFVIVMDLVEFECSPKFSL